MADEVTYAGSGDIRVAALLNRELFELLHDPTDLRSVCRYIPFDAMGSSVIKTGQVQPSYGMSAPGEATTVANTALVDASFSLTIARYALRFEPTDLLQMTSNGNLDVMKLAEIVARNAGIEFTDLLCALFPSLSNSVGGGAGVDLSVDDIYDAIYQLQSTNNSGRLTCVLHPTAWNDFQNSLRGETGANQYKMATADALAAKGPGYAGEWNNVDFYKVDSVTAAAGVLRNAMFASGCFAYTEGPIGKMLPQVDRRIAVADSSVFVTVVFDDDLGTWRVIGNYFPAVGEAEDARGVLINSDD